MNFLSDFQSSSAEEFWPALLEKAYAKAKGSYELLNHWMPIDGCIELTGGALSTIFHKCVVN